MTLEPPLATGAELSGHLVQGHVDGVVVIVGKERERDHLWFTLSMGGAKCASSTIHSTSMGKSRKP